MRKSTEDKKPQTATTSNKLSPELNEFMHMLNMLDHQFAERTTQTNS